MAAAMAEWDLTDPSEFNQNAQGNLWASAASISLLGCFGMIVFSTAFTPVSFIAWSQAINFINVGIFFYGSQFKLVNNQYKISSLILILSSLFGLGVALYMNDFDFGFFEKIKLQEALDYEGMGIFERADFD